MIILICIMTILFRLVPLVCKFCVEHEKHTVSLNRNIFNEGITLKDEHTTWCYSDAVHLYIGFSL